MPLRSLSRREKSGLLGKHHGEETEELQKPNQGLKHSSTLGCRDVGLRKVGARPPTDPCSHPSHFQRGPSLSVCSWTICPGPRGEPRRFTCALLPLIHSGEAVQPRDLLRGKPAPGQGNSGATQGFFNLCCASESLRRLAKNIGTQNHPGASVFECVPAGDSDVPRGLRTTHPNNY